MSKTRMSFGLRERTWFVIIGVVAIVVAGGAAALQSHLRNDVALTAVIAMATVAYTGLTWRLVRSAEADREERRRQEHRATANTCRELLVELRQNQLRKGQTHAWYTHVPFENAALDRARQERATMPDELAHALHEVENRIARFNAVARYNEQQVRMGSGAADSELTRLAVEVHDSLAVAIDHLDRYAASLAAEMP